MTQQSDENDTSVPKDKHRVDNRWVMIYDVVANG